MNLERLMGTEFDRDLYIASSLSREIYAYSIKIPAKFAKKFLVCLPAADWVPRNRPSLACLFLVSL